MLTFLQTVVVDASNHMLGRLASITAKQLLNGQQIVRPATFSCSPFVFACLCGSQQAAEG